MAADTATPVLPESLFGEYGFDPAALQQLLDVFARAEDLLEQAWSHVGAKHQVDIGHEQVWTLSGFTEDALLDAQLIAEHLLQIRMHVRAGGTPEEFEILHVVSPGRADDAG
jgi:hypothetical protein